MDLSKSVRRASRSNSTGADMRRIAQVGTALWESDAFVLSHVGCSDPRVLWGLACAAHSAAQPDGASMSVMQTQNRGARRGCLRRSGQGSHPDMPEDWTVPRDAVVLALLIKAINSPRPPVSVGPRWRRR